MKIRARPIDDHDRRKIAHAKPIQRFGSELRDRQDVRGFDPFAKQRAEAADRRQVENVWRNPIVRLDEASSSL